jgi:hypothetical protein
MCEAARRQALYRTGNTGPGLKAIRKPAAQAQTGLCLRQFPSCPLNVKILTRDHFARSHAGKNAIGGLLDVILALLGRNPFAFNDSAMANVMITLFLLTIYGDGQRHLSDAGIVKEQDVYKQERLVNLQILPYVCRRSE